MPYYKPVFEEMYRSGTTEERITKAKALLVEAGYPNGFETSLWYSAGSAAEATRETGTILQAQLKEVGIDLKLKMVEKGMFTDMHKAGNIPMTLSGWSPDYLDPDSDLFYCMHPNSQYQPMRMGYNNTHAGELIDLGKRLYDHSGDPPERGAIYEELQTIYADDVVGVILYYDSYWEASRTWVEDLEYYPYNKMCPAYRAYKVIPSDWETREPPV